MVVARCIGGHRHEVDDLADAALGEEAGDEDRGVGEIELLRLEPALARAGAEMPAARVVQQ
jgi:hypothetical protein